MTFLIKRRINTELFIDRNGRALYSKWGAKSSGQFQEGLSWRQDQQQVGMKTMNYLRGESQTIMAARLK